MEKKNFVLVSLLQAIQADIDDEKQWVGVLPDFITPADVAERVELAVADPPHSATILPARRNQSPSVLYRAHRTPIASRMTAILTARRNWLPFIEAVKDEKVTQRRAGYESSHFAYRIRNWPAVRSHAQLSSNAVLSWVSPVEVMPSRRLPTPAKLKEGTQIWFN
ncbi:hypothetical protein C8J57DRAFT_1226366 [Mycena rebaudengoi]|nr:hypothetical protein C8J57DRAFT_1226366 [Mycena rebaudengoi]